MEEGQKKKPFFNSLTPSRLFFAFVLGPVPSALMYSFIHSRVKEHPFGTSILHLFFDKISYAPTMIVISWILILFIGTPIYLMLKNTGRLRPLYIIPIAGLITFAPTVFLELTRGWDPNDSFSASIGKCRIIENNIRTPCGYVLLFKNMAEYFAFGCLAGYVFCSIYFKKWLVWK